ncbi:MAG TPA: PP2C family serine/threonine-protein phosphatase [Trueperaceae bacterium]|nr:PP2C family serine/threonine-protein phosphatase [Trueperaceae bacterium]
MTEPVTPLSDARTGRSPRPAAVVAAPPTKPGSSVTHISSSGISEAGRVRSVNQDWFFAGSVGRNGHLGVVADGMGGHTAGEVASRRAIETLVAALRQSRTQPPVSLARAAQAANVEVYNLALDQPELKGMGTTLTAVLLDDQIGLVGHVGDSRAYLVRGTRAQRLTVDHSWVADRVRQGLLSEEEARKHRWRNVITNAIGATPTFRLDVLYFDVLPGDVIVIVSDGVSMLLDEDSIVQNVIGLAPNEAAARLVEAANDRGSPDNVTAVVLRVDEVGLRPKRYDLPGTPLEAASVDIGETLSGIKRVEEGFPSNGPWQKLRRHPLFPYRYWLMGCAYLLVLLVLFLLWRG